MLSLYASNGSMVEERTLKSWIDYIVKDKSDLNIKGAAILYENGNQAASTKRFDISTEDFRNLLRTFFDPALEKVTFRGVTYCVKSRDPSQLVCFNGSKYVIVNRTKKTFIVTYCASKLKSIQVASWINSVAKKLKERRT